MALPGSLAARLSLPLIAAPMFRVSGPDLVIAACREGVIGAFPTANARTTADLDAWLGRIRRELADLASARPVRPVAPFCPNLIVHRSNPRLREDLELVIRHRTEVLIASVGSPEAVIGPLHQAGCRVLADVASLRHAEKALAAGADGLVLLTAGAGGQTGWANPFAFARAVRALFDGPLVMAGGISDGAALLAARTLGCDLAYMGTKFIATHESMASPAYKDMLVRSRLDDVLLTRAFTGLPTNMLRPSIAAAGLDPDHLPERGGLDVARDPTLEPGPHRWKDIWSAGHSVSGVTRVIGVSELVALTRAEYEEARQSSKRALDLDGRPGPGPSRLEPGV